METSIRAKREQIHLLEVAEVPEEDIINARCRYQGTLQEYNRFSREMDLPVQRDRIYVDGWGNIGVGKTKIDLTNKSYDDIIYMKGKMSDRDVRKWYVAHDRNIGELIDKSQTLENQAKQAHSLRNKYKFQARELMENQEKRMLLDKSRPLHDFEYYYKKYSKNYSSDEEIYKAIIESSTRPNAKVNEQLGVK